MTRLRGRIALLLAAVATTTASGCGGGGSSASGGAGDHPTLTVSAAASLKDAFTRYAAAFPDATVRLQFAGSDQLAAQIRAGVRPDVFASANTGLPDALHADGLVEKPVVFAGNRLVLAVPSSSKIRSLQEAARPGVKLAIGSAGVPIGSYTRKVLARLPAAERRALLAGVRTEEPDVAGIVGKLTQQAVDAGFVYITDVRAAGGRLRAVELPKAVQPSVGYGVAVVKGTKHPAAARAFVAGLLGGRGRAALDAAGFERAPAAGS
jgi:molybdate transport system substrate-binding protein